MGVKSFYISLLASLASLIGPVHIFALSGTMWQVFSDGQNRAKQILKKWTHPFTRVIAERVDYF